jgi:AraC-like DNA-binding protein
VVQKPAVHRFHDAFLKLGIDTETLYVDSGIDPAVMTSKDGTLSMDAYFSLLDLASRSSGVRFLGAELPSSLDSSDMGILVYLIRNAHNFEHALVILRRYINLVSPGAEISLFENDSDYVLAYKFTTTAPMKCYQDVEGTMAQFVFMIRDVLQDETWQPKRIYLAHPALNPSDHLNFPVGESVIYGHAFSGVSFPKNVINYPIENSDPMLLSILESQVSQLASNLAVQDTALERIRLLISSGLRHSNSTSSTVATALGMSRRTLTRRLHEAGVTFKELREDIVFELAKSSLVDTKAPVAEIAQEMGYSDSSAFNRVFRRLSGDTPLQYRKRHKKT